jgi:hypothetical protein
MIDEAVVEVLSAQVSVTGSGLNSKVPPSIVKTFKIEDESTTLITDTECAHA